MERLTRILVDNLIRGADCVGIALSDLNVGAMHHSVQQRWLIFPVEL